MKDRDILKRAADVLRIEADGIISIVDRLDDNFIQAVQLLRECRGKVVVTGMGKSGLICRKIAATLASTGTPSFFLHSGDGMHGDLGMVMKGDAILAVSNSGETDEILKLLPHFKLNNLRLIVITGNVDSTLAKAADVVLNVAVKEEACPLGLAPTASTTAALAMGDALAVVLLEEKGFKAEDFALRHPGGILGRKLLLRVEDLMHHGDQLPLVCHDTPMQEALFEITSKRLGVTGVTDGKGRLSRHYYRWRFTPRLANPRRRNIPQESRRNHDREATHDRKRYLGRPSAGDDGRKLAAADHLFVCP